MSELLDNQVDAQNEIKVLGFMQALIKVNCNESKEEEGKTTAT